MKKIIVLLVALLVVTFAMPVAFADETTQVTEVIMDWTNVTDILTTGEGGYLHGETELVLSVVSNRELIRVERIIHDIDPECFMVVSRVSEVRGRGFSEKKEYK